MTKLASADFTAYRTLSQFKTVAEMNDAVRGFLYSHKHQLAPSAVAVLKTLSHYACKLPGVAFMKVATIAAKVELSERTVRRALKTLEDAGIIVRQTTTRRQGGTGHNVYVIADVRASMSGRTAADKPRQTSVKAMSQAVETEPSETMHSGLSKERNKNVINTTRSSQIEALPKSFIAVSRPFAALIDPAEAWRKVAIAKHEAGLKAPMTGDNIVHMAIDAFKATLTAFKTNRIRDDINGYYYGCLRNLFGAAKRREIAADGVFGYDWLTIGNHYNC